MNDNAPKDSGSLKTSDEDQCKKKKPVRKPQGHTFSQRGIEKKG